MMSEDERITDGGTETSSTSIDGLLNSSRKKSLRLLIVRHGETDCNVQGIIQGQMDTDLNQVGRQQAKYVAEALAVEDVDEVYASPLRRAKDTADAIVSEHPNFAVGRLAYWVDDRLKERGFGALEGKTFDRSKPKRDSFDGIEQMKDFGARLASFLADVVPGPAPFIKKSNLENTETIVTRAAQLGEIKDTKDAGALPGSPHKLHKAKCERIVVLVAHGAAISALLGAVLLENNLACMSAGVQRTRIWNCSISEVTVQDTEDLPLFADSNRASRLLDLERLSQREGRKAFMIERWADVRHLPAKIDDAQADTGAADEMVGRSVGRSQ